MTLVSIQTPVFISYCLPVQGRMANAIIGVNKFNSMVRGQYVKKVHGLYSLTKHVSELCGQTATSVTNTL